MDFSASGLRLAASGLSECTATVSAAAATDVLSGLRSWRSSRSRVNGLSKRDLRNDPLFADNDLSSLLRRGFDSGRREGSLSCAAGFAE